MAIKKDKIDFLVIGSQKCGTSTLNGYLKQHPDICTGARKELHFFDKNDNFPIVNNDYSAYHECFNMQFGHKIVGETTPIYIYKSACAKRIYEYNPELKLIIILRNPVERAYSQWNMNCHKWSASESFESSIKVEQKEKLDNPRKQNMGKFYIDRGFYTDQIKNYLQYFNQSNISFVRFEDLIKDGLGTMNAIYKFLGMKKLKKIKTRTYNANEYKSKINSSDREFLRAIYMDEVAQLESLLGWDCSEWLEA